MLPTPTERAGDGSTAIFSIWLLPCAIRQIGGGMASQLLQRTHSEEKTKRMNSGNLANEVRWTQNPAFGALLLWRFVCGFEEANPIRAHTPVPLLFLVLPILLHQPTSEFVTSTQRTSGLRQCVAKFGDAKNSKQD